MNTHTITHRSKRYEFQIENGKLVYSDKLRILPKSVLLLLHFGALRGTYTIGEETASAINCEVGKYLDDRNLNEKGRRIFERDREVLAAVADVTSHVTEQGAPDEVRTGVQTTPRPTPDTPSTLLKANKPNPQTDGVGKPESEQMAQCESADEQAREDRDDKPSQETTTPRIIHHLSLDILTQHPSNAQIYDPALNPALLASIKEHGVKVPIIVTPQAGGTTVYRILSGFQRWGISIQLKIPTIPAIIVDVPEEQQLEILLACNQCRPKTIIERLREYRAFLEFEIKKAEKRSGLRSDLGVKLPQGEDFGKSRDIAGAQVHMSGSTADRGLQVLEELDKQKTAGKKEEAELVWEALLESVHKGATLALHLGWPILGNKNPKRSRDQKHKVASSGPTASSGDEQTDGGEHTEKEVKPIQGWIDEESIDLAMKKSELATDESKVIRAALCRIRPSIYSEFGVSPSKEAAARLRKLAEALIRMADEYTADINNIQE